MPILYDQYQLSNSTQIPKFQGSAIPELTQVMNATQEKYDYGVQQADALDYALKNSAASAFDQPEFQKLKQEYRGKLEGFAKSGDYENMWRNVAMSARDFTGKYKSFADNKQRLSQWQEEVDKEVGKGSYSREVANAAMRKAMDNYQGLQYDPETGQYVGQFNGPSIAKAVDIPKKINSWLESSHAVERGSKVTNIDGDYYVTNGSTTRKLDWNTIQPIIAAAAKLDPEVQSYLNQERELAPYQISGYSRKLSGEQLSRAVAGDPQLKQAMETEMAKGMGANQAFEKIIGESRYSELLNGIQSYARKGIIDERSSEYGKTFNPVGSARATKAIEDETLALTAQIWQPDTNVVYTPESLNDTLSQLDAAAKGSEQKMATWASSVGLKKVGDRYQDKDGNDVTFQYQQKVDIAAQAARTKHNLDAFKLKVQEETGFKLTPDIIAKAEAARTESMLGVEAMRARDRGYTEADLAAKLSDIKERAYNKALEDHPRYKEYKTKLEEYSKTSQLIGVQTFNKTSQNKAAEDMFKNFALNLDKSGPEFGSFGLQWGTGENAGRALTADDYKLVRDNAHFAGVGIDADGQYKFFYKVGDINNKKGGTELVVKMPALAGTSEMLIANGQITEAQQYIAQSISNLPAVGKVAVDKDLTIGVNKQSDGSYDLEFPMDNGKVMKVPASSRGEAVNIIVDALKEKSKRN